MANTAEELVVCSLQNLYCVLQIPYLLEEMHRVMILYNSDLIQNPVQYGLNISYAYFKSIIHIIFINLTRPTHFSLSCKCYPNTGIRKDIQCSIIH